VDDRRSVTSGCTEYTTAVARWCLTYILYHGTSPINVVILQELSLSEISTERPTADWAAIWLQLNTSEPADPPDGISASPRPHQDPSPTPSTRSLSVAASVLDPILSCYTIIIQVYYYNVFISTDTQTAPDPTPMLWYHRHTDFWVVDLSRTGLERSNPLIAP